MDLTHSPVNNLLNINPPFSRYFITNLAVSRHLVIVSDQFISSEILKQLPNPSITLIKTTFSLYLPNFHQLTINYMIEELQQHGH